MKSQFSRRLKVISKWDIKTIYNYLKLSIRTSFFHNGSLVYKDEIKPYIVIISLPIYLNDFPCQDSFSYLSVSYVKSCLKKYGISSLCIDYNNRFHSYLNRNKMKKLINMNPKAYDKFFNKILHLCINEIIKINPQFILISTHSRRILHSLDYFNRILKQKNSKIQIILRGQICAQNGIEFLKKKYGDIIILDENPNVVVEIIKSLRVRKNLKYVKGIMYKRKEKIILQKPSGKKRFLDSLPFQNFDDYNLILYNTHSKLWGNSFLPLYSDVGCSATCKFCNVITYAGKFKTRSPKNIIQEMIYNKNMYGVWKFFFNNAILNKDDDFLNELCNLIIKSQEIFLWGGFLLYKKYIDKDLINKMSKAGCKKIFIGVESGSQKVREEMGKNFSNEEISRILKYLHQSGIFLHLSFIIGFPSETYTDFIKTIAFIKNNKPYIDSIEFNLYNHVVPEFTTHNKYDNEFNSINKYKMAIRIAKKNGIMVQELNIMLDKITEKYEHNDIHNRNYL